MRFYQVLCAANSLFLPVWILFSRTAGSHLKFVRLAVAVVAAVLVVQAPAHAAFDQDLTLVDAPGYSGITLPNNNTTYGFGGDGVGSSTNLNAKYFVDGTFGGPLHNAPVSILFVFGPNGQVSTYSNSLVGPYDDVEDTQIGVLNESGSTLTSIKLKATSGDPFGFDADGISAPYSNGATAEGAGAPSNNKDSSDGLYGGPITYFTLNAPGATGNFSTSSALTAFANFKGGLANGSSTYFSLEGDPSDLGNLGSSMTTPEPASLTLLGFGA